MATEPAFEPLETPDLESLLRLAPAEFRLRFRHSAIKRPKRAGFLRNVAIALGNQRDERSVPALQVALSDPEPLIRGAAAWALGRIGGVAALDCLEGRLANEEDGNVQAELRLAILELRNTPAMVRACTNVSPTS